MLNSLSLYKILKNEIEKIKLDKINVVKSQNYEKALDLRDKERKFLTKLESLTKSWEEKQKE